MLMEVGRGRGPLAGFRRIEGFEGLNNVVGEGGGLINTSGCKGASNLPGAGESTNAPHASFDIGASFGGVKARAGCHASLSKESRDIP